MTNELAYKLFDLTVVSLFSRKFLLRKFDTFFQKFSAVKFHVYLFTSFSCCSGFCHDGLQLFRSAVTCYYFQCFHNFFLHRHNLSNYSQFFSYFQKKSSKPISIQIFDHNRRSECDFSIEFSAQPFV